MTLDMFNFSSGLFISFRFAKYSNTRLKIGQNTLTWSSSLSIIWVSSKSGSSIDTSSKTESLENDCNWVVGDWVVKLLTDSSAMLTNCSECYTLGSNRKPPEIWLTAAKNVTVGWGLNFRVRMLLKTAVNSGIADWSGIGLGILSVQNLFRSSTWIVVSVILYKHTMTHPQPSWNPLLVHPFSLKKISLAHPMIPPTPHLNNDQNRLLLTTRQSCQ